MYPPALFNIYLEHILKIIKNNLRFDNFFYKAYADDLVIIVKHIHLPRTIKEIK
jgi:hypothetical protein